MAQDCDLLGPDCSPRELAALFHRVTGDKPTMHQLHPINMRDELTFDELVELLVRLALKIKGTKQQIRSVAQARTALLQMVHDFLVEYYVATDRFYTGNLKYAARQINFEPELAARLQLEGGEQGGRGRGILGAATPRGTGSVMGGAATPRSTGRVMGGPLR